MRKSGILNRVTLPPSEYEKEWDTQLSYSTEMVLLEIILKTGLRLETNLRKPS